MRHITSISFKSSFLQRNMPGKVLIGSFGSFVTLFDYDSATRTLSYDESIENPSPSWLTLSKHGNTLFTTNELDNFDGNETGAVSSYVIDPNTGKLEVKSRIPSSLHGKHPTHLIEHPSSNMIYASCYSSGSLSVHKYYDDGVIEASCQSIIHFPRSGAKSHVHQIYIDRMGEIATVVDLGNDHIIQYHLDRDTGMLIEPTTILSSIEFPLGSGPRHIAVHPGYDLAVVICELSSTIMPLHYDHKTNILKHFDNIPSSISTLRAGECHVDMAGAEIIISKNGRFIYVSNRDISSSDDDNHTGRDSIAVFRINNASSGMISLQQVVSSGGRHPRHFLMIEDDSVMLIANKDSHSIACYRVDADTGMIDEASLVISSSPHLQDPTFVLLI